MDAQLPRKFDYLPRCSWTAFQFIVHERLGFADSDSWPR